MTKSLSPLLPSCTSPNSLASPYPSPFRSSQKRNPECAGPTVKAESSTLRASGRGVSSQIGDHALSRPSTLIAETAKQRDTPLGSAPARNSGATVLPSIAQAPVHTLSTTSKLSL